MNNPLKLSTILRILLYCAIAILSFEAGRRAERKEQAAEIEVTPEPRIYFHTSEIGQPVEIFTL